MRVNPARQLEHLVEAVLAQKLYAVEFAWGFTLLEQHLDSLAHQPRNDEERAFGERLERAVQALRVAMAQVRRFTEEVDLGELDRGLAGARAQIYPFDELQALARRLQLTELAEGMFVLEALERGWQRSWEASVTRHQGETRAVFTCRACGWELTWVQEVGSAEELEMPFAELSCPLCSGASSDEEDDPSESPPERSGT